MVSEDWARTHALVMSTPYHTQGNGGYSTICITAVRGNNTRRYMKDVNVSGSIGLMLSLNLRAPTTSCPIISAHLVDPSIQNLRLLVEASSAASFNMPVFIDESEVRIRFRGFRFERRVESIEGLLQVAADRRNIFRTHLRIAY